MLYNNKNEPKSNIATICSIVIGGYTENPYTTRCKMERATAVFTPLIRVMRREHLRDEARAGITKDCDCMRRDIDKREAGLLAYQSVAP